MQLALMLQGKYDPMKDEGNKALVEEALEVSLSPRIGQECTLPPPHPKVYL